MTILGMVAEPFDGDLEVTLPGPPVPFGFVTAGAEADGWNYLGALTTVYLSEAGFVTLPSDTPSNVIFKPRLIDSFNYSVRLFQGDEPSGETRPGLGSAKVANGDGELDNVLAYGWDGRLVRLYEGESGAAFSTFSLVFEGSTRGLEWGAGKVTFKLRDRQVIFDRDIHQSIYTGLGGAGGGTDLTGKGRPLLYGKAFNIPAVPVDTTNLIYQISDGPIVSVDGVRDKGIDLPIDATVGTGGDVADYAALVAASVGANKHATSLAAGLIKIGTAPDGLVTCDATGSQTTTGTIIRNIITTNLGSLSLFDPTELDTAAFTQMEIDQPATVGYWVGTPVQSVRQVLDNLMRAVGGYWFVTLPGKFSLGILKAPSGTADYTFTTADFSLSRGLERSGTLPSWRRLIGWQPLWRTQTADELAGAVSAANRAFYSEQSRFAESSNSNVRNRHPLAREVVVPAYFSLEADAQTEANRQQTLFGVRRDTYTLKVKGGLFDYQLSGIAEMASLGRFGFAADEKLVVIGITADAKKRSVSLDLWR